QASSIGLSFAVPAATAEFVAKSLRQRRQVVRASLDVKIIDSTDTQGVIVTEILPNGILDKLNQSAKHVIKPNDRLVQLNRFPIRKASELTDYLNRMSQEDLVQIGIIHAGSNKVEYYSLIASDR